MPSASICKKSAGVGECHTSLSNWVTPFREEESFRGVEGDREGYKGVVGVIYVY